MPDDRFWFICKTSMARAVKVALIVGTALVAINQGDVILAGIWPPVWKLLLTYAVPFLVSSYSTAALLVEQRRQAENAPPM